MRWFKKLFKFLVAVVAGIFCFGALYVIYNWPMAPKYKRLSREDLGHYHPVFGRTFLLVEMAPFQRLHMWLLKTYYPFGGVFDKLYEVRRRSFAFDVQSSPFASAEDNYSFYSLDRWGSLELREFSDGYIVLCSFQEAQPVHPVARWIVTTSDSLDVFERMSPDKRAGFGSIQGLLQALADESPKNMRVFHAVGTAGYAQ